MNKMVVTEDERTKIVPTLENRRLLDKRENGAERNAGFGKVLA